ncbi:metallophosphoesterase family protein [Paenibacillus sp. FSL R7-0345]|uniref:metallophosphoesterase family protein n=1 Tax=Paenibacillus sp. FSL R7-0345 TaxID=2954535 RepID=UPI00315A8840
MQLNKSSSIAVISDIHSNSYALEAVLNDIDSRGIKTIVNLGDTLFGPIDPIKTAELLMKRPHITNIMGNCDRYLLQDQMDSLTFHYVKPLLTQEINHWIQTFNRTCIIDDLLFCHGTPLSDDEYLLDEVSIHGVVEKSVEKLMSELAFVDQKLIFCGHTHKQKTVWLPDGKWIVNAGSVGLPAYFEDTPHPHYMESKTPHAKYVIVSRNDQSWVLENILLPYDYELAAQRADQNDREDYSYAIRYGRAKRM